MASSQKFRDYVVNQFSGEFSVTTRKMMGEYILYSQKKIFGGIVPSGKVGTPLSGSKTNGIYS